MNLSKLYRPLLFRRYKPSYHRPEMLKNREIAKDLYRKRLEDKKKNNLVVNDAKLIILGANCQGFSPSLLLYSEGNGYMFNCNEGIQRFCYSNRIKLMDVGNLFITNVDWHRISGSYGAALTVQDIGMPSLTINANDSTEDLFNVAESFMKFHTGMHVINRPYSEGVFKDGYITIEPIPLDHEETSGNPKKSNAKIIAYLCDLPDLPGTLNPAKCRQLKVPVGPCLGKLKAGEDITLPDGTIVRSVDVTGPKHEGPKILVIECPTTSDIDRVVSNTHLSAARSLRRSNGEKEVLVVAHFSPINVTNDARYKEWMDGFPEDCKHLLLSDPDLNTLPNFIGCYQHHYLLRKLDSEIFPPLMLPKSFTERVITESKNPDKPLLEDIPDDDNRDFDQRLLTKLDDFAQLNRIHKTCSLDRINFRPHKVVSGVDSAIKLSTLYEETQLDPEFAAKFATLKELQANMPEPKPYEPEIVFLGTGSSVPSKYRNLSCILINFTEPKPYSVILDCGEDSFGQLHRHFGPEGMAEVLAKLKMIYVSHHHADHHLGMVKLLRERAKYTNEQVALLLPPGLTKVLDYHNQNFVNIEHTYRIFSTKLLKTSSSALKKLRNDVGKDLYEFMGGLLDEVKMIPVEHCVHSCAVVLKFKLAHEEMANFTIAYSGDARPCEEFAYEGKDCDLLIHEATFDDRSQTDAIIKKHCTTDEAIEVARNMNAKFTILTHFSQRLSKIPYFNHNFHDKIGFAFDNLRLRCPSQLSRLPILKDTLTTVFHKSLTEIDVRYLRSEEKNQLLIKFKKEFDEKRI